MAELFLGKQQFWFLLLMSSYLSRLSRNSLIKACSWTRKNGCETQQASLIHHISMTPTWPRTGIVRQQECSSQLWDIWPTTSMTSLKWHSMMIMKSVDNSASHPNFCLGSNILSQIIQVWIGLMWLNCIQQRSTSTKSHSNSASPRFLNAKRMYQVLISKTGFTSSLTRTWLSCSSSFLCRSKLVLYISRTHSVFIKYILMTTLVICMFQNFDKIEMLTNSESTAIKYIVNCKSKVFICKNSTPWWLWT